MERLRRLWTLLTSATLGAGLAVGASASVARGQQQPPHTPPGYESTEPPPSEPGERSPAPPSQRASTPSPRQAPSPPQRPPRRPGHHTHDGFFFRVAPGIGYTSGRFDESDVRVGGVGGNINIALGGAVVENFILHTDLFGASAANPTVYEDGEDVGNLDQFSFSGLGAGMTFYFMPANVYLSGSVGFGAAALNVDLVVFESDVGVTMNTLVGKEWWMNDDWAIGGALRFMYLHVPGDSENFNAFGAGAAFSATYN